MTMPKYRLLTPQELKELEKEFIEYLIINGISAEDWASIQKKDAAKHDKEIELFSDVVFESILQKISFLEYRSKNSLQIFQCLPDKLVVVSMESSSEFVNFMDQAYITNATNNPPEDLKVYTASKSYKTIREVELFEMLQTGCVITDDRLFKTLCLLLAT